MATEAPFTPSSSAQPPTRVPERLAKMIAIDKALRKIASSPPLVTAAVRQTAEDAAMTYQDVFIPLRRNAVKAYQADYVLKLAAAGDRGVTPELKAASQALVDGWLSRADRVIASKPAGLDLTAWIAGVTGEAQQEASNAVSNALTFWTETASDMAKAAVKAVNDAAGDAAKKALDAIPWYVWAIGGVVALGAFVYLLAPVRGALTAAVSRRGRGVGGVGGYQHRRLARHRRR